MRNFALSLLIIASSLSFSMENQPTQTKTSQSSEVAQKVRKCSCEKIFDSYEDIIEHIYSKHFDQESIYKFPCKTCKKRFKYPDDLLLHFTIHTHETVYHCRICNFRPTQKKPIANHLDIHTKYSKAFEYLIKHGIRLSVDGYFYKCPNCDFFSDQLSTMIDHFNEIELPILKYKIQLPHYPETTSIISSQLRTPFNIENMHDIAESARKKNLDKLKALEHYGHCKSNNRTYGCCLLCNKFFNAKKFYFRHFKCVHYATFLSEQDFKQDDIEYVDNTLAPFKPLGKFEGSYLPSIYSLIHKEKHPA